MADFNQAILIGRLVADPELKTTQTGISVAQFRIAVNRKTGKDQQPQADFFDIVAWRFTAEFVCKYFKKGQYILVRGSIQNRSWKDKNGNQRTITELVAEEASFVGNKESNSNNTNGNDGFEEINPEDDFPF